MSQTEIDERKELINKLFRINVEQLDIGNAQGSTGYIDFIKPTSLDNNNIMKGRDINGRRFIVFKAEIILSNSKKIQTFTTFFQRYYDSDLTWHTCGHYGLNLFDTCGGVNNIQARILYELLSNNSVDLNNFSIDELDNLKLLWKNGLDEEYNASEDIYPTQINVGYSI